MEIGVTQPLKDAGMLCLGCTSISLITKLVCIHIILQNIFIINENFVLYTNNNPLKGPKIHIIFSNLCLWIYCAPATNRSWNFQKRVQNLEETCWLYGMGSICFRARTQPGERLIFLNGMWQKKKTCRVYKKA